MRGARFVWAALGYCVAVSLLLAFALPMGTSVTEYGECDAQGCTQRSEESTSRGLYETDGVGALVVLAVPVVVSAVAVAGRRRRAHRVLWLVCAGLLGVGCLLGMLTVGIFYVPAVVLLLVAGLVAERRRPAGSSAPTASTAL